MTAADRARPRRAARKRVEINLALQGGGAHGAFTWGALSRLLDEEDIEIEGVSATSAGAMNAAMLATGLKRGGREEAKRRLDAFWGRIRAQYPMNHAPWSVWANAFGLLDLPFVRELNPAYLVADLMTRMVSPYQFNPVDINPLRDLLHEMIDFGEVCNERAPRLFVCATDVRSGRAHIFRGAEISVDALLASACLPTLYQAVRIDGRDYWDGGYTGNPALWPLVYHCRSEDILLVQINPIERDETPMDARGIQNRINEISFNATLMNEMRAIDTIGRLVDEGKLPTDRYKRMRIHAAEDAETMRALSASTKLSPDGRMLDALRASGVAAMEGWLAAHRDKLGRESSLDLRAKYL